ncbi:MAG: IS66 family insertion sequence element accessory protein TnpB [Candidatus Eisenbacteria bacterium]|nr:IS66 family insertion sequence element accessory protein TnpB [Candidatus Eisenbacteria bacterium]
MRLGTDPSRILAYRHPVDMRKSYDGLIALVRSALAEDPLSGTIYVFTNRRGTHLKCVFWDRTGFCILAKRLEHGRFALPGEENRCELSEQAFRLILDGIVLGVRARVV